ncbi:ABC transporter substrate-binding protein [Luteimonas deserti]|uniref:ABC transporter substrate-binding protein n=1 Tax=Luteimonas deserti TaxID=2752306 RepID=A0A7Z0QSX9_9GAMM|nr:ABC transporter substrate-binding protein [Luteimonas deserti]NYZ63346.1 ABC transporter substrate-binding protein [Luteimonas deserti]
MPNVSPLVLALALAIAPVAASERPTPLGIDAASRGEITSRSAINYRDGSRSQLHTLDLRKGQVVSIALEGPLRGRLTAFHGDDLVASSGEGARASSLVVRAAQAGRHTIAVSGIDASAFGPYSVRVSTVEAYDGQPLMAGASISDWTSGPRPLSLRIDEAGVYTIDMLSDDFDAVLKLDGPGVSLSNDDGGEGTNARISARLAPGTYTLTADGYGGERVSGLYRLQVNARATPDAPMRDGGPIAAGETVNGLHDGAAHSYTFTLPARRLVRIDLRSDEIDPLLRLSGTGVEITDDDGGDGLHARIATLLDAGEYTVRAEAAAPGAGFYTLSLAADEAPADVGGGALAAGRPVDATLMPGMTDRWSLNVRSAGQYTIDMRSGDLDSHLRLLRGAEVLASDDDGGDNLDSRIVQRLEPGQYTVEATAVGGSETGRYRIAFERR